MAKDIVIDEALVTEWEITWNQSYWSDAKDDYVGEDPREDEQTIIVPAFVTLEEIRKDLEKEYIVNDEDNGSDGIWDDGFEITCVAQEKKKVSELTKEEFRSMMGWVSGKIYSDAEKSILAIQQARNEAMARVEQTFFGNDDDSCDIVTCNGTISIRGAKWKDPSIVELGRVVTINFPKKAE